MRRTPLLAALSSLLLAPLVGLQATADAGPPDRADRADRDRTVRFSTFNASLNRNNAGDLVRDLSTPDNQQARTSPRRSSG